METQKEFVAFVKETLPQVDAVAKELGLSRTEVLLFSLLG